MSLPDNVPLKIKATKGETPILSLVLDFSELWVDRQMWVQFTIPTKCQEEVSGEMLPEVSKGQCAFKTLKGQLSDIPLTDNHFMDFTT